MSRGVRIGLLVLIAWFAAGPAALRAQSVGAVEAVAGEPLGVGRVVVDLPAAELPEPLGAAGLGLSAAGGRLLYPAWRSTAMPGIVKELIERPTPLTTGGPVRQQLGGILRDILNRPPPTTLYFLFRGDGPLELTLQARRSIPLGVVQPRHEPLVHRRLLDAWWRDYAAGGPRAQSKPDCPPLVETYLLATLARRLNLRIPRNRQTPSAYAEFARESGVMTGNESVRTALEQDRLLGLAQLDQPADRPLPTAVESQMPEAIETPPPAVESPSPPPPPPPLPAGGAPPPGAGPARAGAAAELAIEPIAMHVPEECFYIRFGSYDNFLWFQDTLDTWGGDLQNLVAQRGLNDDRGERLQRQLVLKQSQLSRLLGGTVISDVAMIGTDMLFHDGAAIGFLFEARNSLLLGHDLAGQRADRVKQGGANEQTLTIEGQPVSLLESADGSVRSYYAARGDYHFVTTSRTLATRFLQTVRGRGSLGVSKEFRDLRRLLPITREDAVLAHFSAAFFRNFLSPGYRVEMLRRLTAATDLDLVLLARLAAAAEGKPAGTIEQLVAGGLLPPGFGPRPDGSRAILAGGELRDSLRGRRGLFLPVPDVPVGRVTAAEEQSYRRAAEACLQPWGRLEPVTVAVQRKALAGKRERIVLDARMSPLSRQRSEFFQKWAGPPDTQQLAAVAGDIAAGEVVLREQRLLGGLSDVISPLPRPGGGLLSWLDLRNTIIGYLGTTGQGGVLGILDLTFPAADPNGYSRNVLGLWRLRNDRFTLYSFQSAVLAAVTPQLRFQPSPRPAQLRLHVGDVARAQIMPMLNQWAYQRTRQTVLGNLRLLHSLEEQLHVPPQDCLKKAEWLLAAKLVCPLGGQYVLRAEGGPPHWTSTRLEPAAAGPLAVGPLALGAAGALQAAPAGFVARPLQWFRGLDLEATLAQAVLAAHADLVMQLPGGQGGTGVWPVPGVPPPPAPRR